MAQTGPTIPLVLARTFAPDRRGLLVVGSGPANSSLPTQQNDDWRWYGDPRFRPSWACRSFGSWDVKSVVAARLVRHWAVSFLSRTFGSRPYDVGPLVERFLDTLRGSKPDTEAVTVAAGDGTEQLLRRYSRSDR